MESLATRSRILVAIASAALAGTVSLSARAQTGSHQRIEVYRFNTKLEHGKPKMSSISQALP